MIERIDETHDPRIADYRHVGEPAWLKAQGLFVAEGRLVVRRLLREPRFGIRSILVTPVALDALFIEPEPPIVTDQDRTQQGEIDPTSARLKVFVTSQAVLNAVTGFNFHRGCLALAERPPDCPIEEVAAAPGVLVLENVSNPDNVGGLFRVAAAFGVGVLLDASSGDPLYRKAVRTSMGTVLSVPHARLHDCPAGLKQLSDRGFTVVALTPRGRATVREVAARKPSLLAVVVGAEGAGLTAAVMDTAHYTARIPMPGGIDSLNVTVAAGIAWSHLLS